MARRPHYTTLSGYLFSPMGDIMPNTEIIAESTDSTGTNSGVRCSHTTNDIGKYNFNLTGGYHKLYVNQVKDDNGIEKYLGLVHITKKDIGVTHTIEDLLV